MFTVHITCVQDSAIHMEVRYLSTINVTSHTCIQLRMRIIAHTLGW